MRASYTQDTTGSRILSGGPRMLLSQPPTVQSRSAKLGPLPFARRAEEGISWKVLAGGEMGLVTIDSQGCIPGGRRGRVEISGNSRNTLVLALDGES